MCNYDPPKTPAADAAFARDIGTTPEVVAPVMQDVRGDLRQDGALGNFNGPLLEPGEPVARLNGQVQAVAGLECDCGKIEHGRHHMACPTMRELPPPLPAAHNSREDDLVSEAVAGRIEPDARTLILRTLDKIERDEARVTETCPVCGDVNDADKEHGCSSDTPDLGVRLEGSITAQRIRAVLSRILADDIAKATAEQIVREVLWNGAGPKCPTCLGDGVVTRKLRPGVVRGYDSCPTCHGDGDLELHAKKAQQLAAQRIGGSNG